MPHNTPHHQFQSLHYLHHKNPTQHQNINHSCTVHLHRSYIIYSHHSYIQYSNHPHHSYTQYSHHYHQHHYSQLYHQHHHSHRYHQHYHHHHHHHTNTNLIPHGTRNLSPAQTLHSLNVSNYSLDIIFPTLSHLSPNVAGTSAIETLGEYPTMSTAATQGSHHHLAKKFNTKYNKKLTRK